jgi:hypothetical protein
MGNQRTNNDLQSSNNIAIVILQLVVKRIWCKWTCETNQHYTKTQINVSEQHVVRKDIDVNEHDRLWRL